MGPEGPQAIAGHARAAGTRDGSPQRITVALDKQPPCAPPGLPESPTARVPLALELCAGTARLTRALISVGFEAVGVDHEAGRHRPEGPCVKADLGGAAGADIVYTAFRSGRLALVHMAPPCGTASAARSRPVPAHLRAAGAPWPKPLRSKAWPRGLPWLSGAAQEKVLAANRIYDFFVEICLMCLVEDVLFCVENPASSLMWHIDGWSTVAMQPGVVEVVFDACMHGGTRPKRTKLLSNCDGLLSMALMCDGSHPHQAWGLSKRDNNWVFATADEAAYPRAMCGTMAELFAKALDTDRFVLPVADSVCKGIAQAPVGKQRRNFPGSGLVPPPKTTVVVTPKNRLRDLKQGSRRVPEAWKLPKGSKVRAIVDANGGDSAAPCPSAGVEHGDGIAEVTVDVPLEPQDFLEWAKTVSHPMEGEAFCKDDVADNIFQTLVDGPAVTARKRVNALKHWAARAGELDPAERQLHAELHPAVRRVLRGRRILLLREAAVASGCKDMEFFEELKYGARLVGMANASGEFPERFMPPIISVDELVCAAKWARPRASGKARGSGDVEADAVLYDKTRAEALEKGWLQGPFSAEELDVRFGKWTVSRRFPVRQGSSIRPVDDFSESLVNSAFGCGEKINLEGIDDVATTAKVMRRALAGLRTGKAVVGKECGYDMVGNAHSAWRAAGGSVLLGRTLDLEAAYRQLPVHPDDHWCSVLSVFCPGTQEEEYYVCVALPFGAAASVLFFSRFAKILRHILVRLFGLCLCNYFDDFPQLEFEGLGESAQRTAELALDLFGVLWSRKPEKRLPFDDRFTCLGVVFSLGDVGGAFAVENKAARVEELRARIDAVLASRRLSPADAASLRGRILFATAQTFGRVGACVASIVGERAQQPAAGSFFVDDRLRSALVWLSDFLSASAPRKVYFGVARKPVVIFTDGAYEDVLSGGTATCGGVMWDPQDRALEFFGAAADRATLEAWREPGRLNVVHQAELFPVYVSLVLWGSRVCNRPVIVFVDNEAAREALVKGYSAAGASLRMCLGVHMLCARHACLPWFARVCSASNPADDPSRLRFEKLLSRGAVCRSVDLGELWSSSPAFDALR